MHPCLQRRGHDCLAVSATQVLNHRFNDFYEGPFPNGGYIQVFEAWFQIMCLDLRLPTFQSTNAIRFFFFFFCDLRQHINFQSCKQKHVKDGNTNPNKINLSRAQIQSNRLHVRASKSPDSKDYCHTPQASCATLTKRPKLISD